MSLKLKGDFRANTTQLALVDVFSRVLRPKPKYADLSTLC